MLKTSLRRVCWLLNQYMILILVCLLVALVSVNPLLALASDDLPIAVEVVSPTPTVTPSAQASLPVGASLASAKVDIEITGVEPFSLVQVFAQSTPVLIAQGFADAKGIFRAKVTLPNNLEGGNHSIVASVQGTDGTTKEITLVKFTVTANGLIAARQKHSGGSSGGTITESPVPKPSSSGTATPGASADGAGVLFVGGVTAASKATINGFGEPAELSISVQNAYIKAYALKVKFQVLSVFSTVVAEIPEFTTSKIAKNETRILSAKTDRGIGQWGFYTARVTVTPPTKIGTATLRPIIRDSLFFVWPLLSMAIVLGLALALMLLRMYLILWPVVEEEQAE